MQLADHDALGAVDDELTAADHDRHVAEVHFFLARLFLVKAQLHLERPTIGQPQLTTFIRTVAGLAQLVFEVLQR